MPEDQATEATEERATILQPETLTPTVERKTAEQAEREYIGPATDAELEESEPEPESLASEPATGPEADPEQEYPEPTPTVARLQKVIRYFYNRGLAYRNLGKLDTHQRMRMFAVLVDRVTQHKDCQAITASTLDDVFVGDEARIYAEMGLEPDQLVELLTEVIHEIDTLGV